MLDFSCFASIVDDNYPVFLVEHIITFRVELKDSTLAKASPAHIVAGLLAIEHCGKYPKVRSSSRVLAKWLNAINK